MDPNDSVSEEVMGPATEPMDEDMEASVNGNDAAFDDSESSSSEEESSEEENGPIPTSSSKKKTTKEKKKKATKTTNGTDSSTAKKVKKPRKTYLPGMQMKEGETLVCEESAYVTLHTFTTIAPCLSFDIIPDSLGSNRTKFPLTAYAVGGTQAQRSHANNLIVMKVLYLIPCKNNLPPQKKRIHTRINRMCNLIFVL